MNKNALIVFTSNNKLGNTGKKTGWFLSEASHVYWPLHNAGFTIDFASPLGGDAPVEEESMKLDDPLNKRFVEKFSIKKGIATIPMKHVDPKKYQVIYFAGGHGTMWDFPDNADIERVVAKIYEQGGIVSAVCHGPSALTSVKLSNGKYLVDGKAVNSFTDAEEVEVKKDKFVPFLLESRLRERGGKFESAKNWGEKVVVDDRLITGQNPQSAAALGEAIVSTFNRLNVIDSSRSRGQEGFEDQPSM